MQKIGLVLPADEIDKVMNKHDLTNKKTLDYRDFRRLFILESPEL